MHVLRPESGGKRNKLEKALARVVPPPSSPRLLPSPLYCFACMHLITSLSVIRPRRVTRASFIWEDEADFFVAVNVSTWRQRLPGRCTKYNVSTPSPDQARLLRKREAAGGGGSFLWRMPPNTTSNGLLYDPLFPGATAARSVLLRSPSPRVGGTRCDRGGDSPRTWPLVAPLARVDRRERVSRTSDKGGGHPR